MLLAIRNRYCWTVDLGPCGCIHNTSLDPFLGNFYLFAFSLSHVVLFFMWIQCLFSGLLNCNLVFSDHFSNFSRSWYLNLLPLIFSSNNDYLKEWLMTVTQNLWTPAQLNYLKDHKTDWCHIQGNYSILKLWYRCQDRSGKTEWYGSQKSMWFSLYAVILHNITISMEYPKSCF